MQEHKIILQEPPAGYRYKLDENGCVQYRKPEIGEIFVDAVLGEAAIAECAFPNRIILEKIPRWRAELGYNYWRIVVNKFGSVFAVRDQELGLPKDTEQWNNGNYYKQEEAESIAEKIKAIIKGEA